MFPEELQCSEKLEIVLSNIKNDLAQNDSIENIKKSLDKLQVYSKNAKWDDKNSIQQPIDILKHKLIVKAYSMAAEKYPTYADKLKVLKPIKDMLLDVQFDRLDHKTMFLNVYNRVRGLQELVK